MLEQEASDDAKKGMMDVTSSARLILQINVNRTQSSERKFQKHLALEDAVRLLPRNGVR